MAQYSTPVSFKLADGHGYVLDKSHLEACRLNLQHMLFRNVFQFSIHPGVKLPASNPIIVDVAAGTCLWILDVAREIPTAQLDGAEVDFTKAPHASWLPQNVTLQSWDIFEDPPPSFIGKYDFVHVRLLVLVLSGLDAKPVLRRLLQLLKPGGTLQWDDLDCMNMHVKKVDPSVLAPALDEICTLSYSSGRHDWLLSLPEMLEAEGFQHAQLHHYSEGPAMTRAFNDLHMLTMDEFAGSLMRLGKTEAAENLYRLIREVYQESVGGAALCIPRIVVVARRGTMH
ncbi:uncharacterized protein TRUGW13939_01431 [Talaromyces rugulosus]|uniref:Methyltransferase domain-containing protein n=1 Tax=Talaromyces rugulosus TaxID=121627 RepID=A0A7H8QLF0_TALRU|nr:uncharacterized protein TRUGW13939_01431 [Talaromyces rugulosus]QKX54345.1 hypothetical protein TRUGW13939_01431 [Talaromyces rugulosus]